jgi:hypothetical protein
MVENGINNERNQGTNKGQEGIIKESWNNKNNLEGGNRKQRQGRNIGKHAKLKEDERRKNECWMN